jgi:hypothetical protein
MEWLFKQEHTTQHSKTKLDVSHHVVSCCTVKDKNTYVFLQSTPHFMKYKHMSKIINLIYFCSLQWNIQRIQRLHVCVIRSVVLNKILQGPHFKETCPVAIQPKTCNALHTKQML